MKYLSIRKGTSVALLLFFFVFTSCNSGYSVQNIEGGRVAITDEFDQFPADKEVVSVINKYKNGLDSIMSPVVGYAARNLDSHRPESPMSNLMADLLRQTAVKSLGKPADIAVMNIGGIRNSFTEGAITFGNIFEIAPFENAFCVLVMDGKAVQELFEQIAYVRGEGLSGANLVISKDRKLISASIAGKPVDPNKDYTVATIDYLAEGNDKMPAFLKAKSKIFPENSLLRSLLLEYVQNCNKKGIKVDAKVEGRIIVK